MHPQRMACHLQPPDHHVPAELLEYGQRRREILDIDSEIQTLWEDLKTLWQDLNSLNVEGFVYTPGAKPPLSSARMSRPAAWGKYYYGSNAGVG